MTTSISLVIVIAGISKPLLNQSTQRIRKDLQIGEVDGHLRWVTYTNPANNDNNCRFIQQALNEWRDPLVPTNEKATVLITVMKNHLILKI
jgi:ABC-type branched-subunit amino acid transport system substrate-binding protein